MNHIDQLYLQIIYNTCVQNPTDFITIQPENEQPLTELTKVQSTLPFLLSYIKNPTILNSLKHQTKLMMLNYYQIEQFTRRIADLFDANNISYILLKGISLAAFYPVPEYRQLGDVDIYINDKEMFNRASALLLANGYTKDDEISDHHQGYLYKVPQTGRTMILELHYRIVGLYQYAPVNKIVDDVFAANTFSPVMQTINDRNYPVLPPFTICSSTICTVVLAYAFCVTLHFFWDTITQRLTLPKFIRGVKNQKSCTYMKSFWKHAASILVCQKRLIPKFIITKMTVRLLSHNC